MVDEEPDLLEVAVTEKEQDAESVPAPDGDAAEEGDAADDNEAAPETDAAGLADAVMEAVEDEESDLLEVAVTEDEPAAEWVALGVPLCDAD